MFSGGKNLSGSIRVLVPLPIDLKIPQTSHLAKFEEFFLYKFFVCKLLFEHYTCVLPFIYFLIARRVLSSGDTKSFCPFGVIPKSFLNVISIDAFIGTNLVRPPLAFDKQFSRFYCFLASFVLVLKYFSDCN